MGGGVNECSPTANLFVFVPDKPLFFKLDEAVDERAQRLEHGFRRIAADNGREQSLRSLVHQRKLILSDRDARMQCLQGVDAMALEYE